MRRVRRIFTTFTTITVLLIVMINMMFGGAVLGADVGTQKAAGHTPKARLEDDFYDYVNHDMIERYKANGCLSYEYLATLNEMAGASNAQIISECVANAGTYEKGSPEQQIGDIFRCAMDMETRNQVGWAAYQEIIDSLKEAETVEEYMEILPMFMTLGEGALITLWTGADAVDTTKMLVRVTASDFFLKKSIYVEEDMKWILEGFEKYMVTLFMTAGYDEEQAKQSAENTLRIAREGALLDLDVEEKTQVENSYNIFTLEEMQEIYSNIDFVSLAKKLGFDENDRFKVEVVENTKYVNSLLTQEHIREICDYTLFVILNDNAEFGPIAARDAKIQLQKEIYGMDVPTDDRYVAQKVVENLMKWQLGDVYAKTNFDEEIRSEIEDLIRVIQKKYIELTDRQDWLSQDCKDMIRKKMETMTIRVGAPKDPTPMEVVFDVVAPEEGGNLLQNIMNYYRAAYEKDMKDYRMSFEQGRDETRWVLYPSQAQGYYKYFDNSINISAGILKPPYYRKGMEESVLLAGIGCIISHEISHAFDSGGRQYDENGDYRIWWNKEEDEVYRQKAEAIVEQYDSVVCETGKHVNGSNTLTENIADLAALTVMAEYVKEKGLDLDTFFKAYAFNCMQITTDERLNTLLATDVHAPYKVRANTVLSNTDLFYEVYDIKETDGMYIAPEDRVGIWR